MTSGAGLYKKTGLLPERLALLAVAFMVGLAVMAVVEYLRWERLDTQTLKELSVEQGRAITHAAAYWRKGKIVKVKLRGPDINEVRYFDGRIETQ